MAKFDTFLSDIKGKSAAVLGLGVSNRPLIRILSEAGVKITVCDKKEASAFASLMPELQKQGISFRFGERYLEGLDQDYIFRSPGIRPDHPLLKKAAESGSVITSETEVFLEVCPCPVIAVTGSDGKTTTSTLISKIVEEMGKKCYLGGNIGKPLLKAASSINEDDIAVLELSSFQLMTMKKSPKISVVTNVAPNHLDWHTSMEEYITAKENIFKYQGKNDTVVLNADNKVTAGYALTAPGRVILFSRKNKLNDGVYINSGEIRIKGKTVVALNDILLPGQHNVENYMSAAAACWALFGEDCFEAVRRVAATFKGVEHRIEFVREKDGVRFYNDSIASSPTRTIAGLNSFGKKVLLIAGGYDKHIPFDVLGPEIAKHVKALYLTGQTAGKIKEALVNCPEYNPEELKVKEYPLFSDAVTASAKEAQKGDIVLMSPACASFDAFKNFEERGQKFKDIINSL
ncbi:MAG: UDP-N-acetylmuramoyl-L-alanine--D-glutamate ligase [Bacillota bacterium]|nr:UDP-N-acetylmuramoyl-L-alanine--D-glutamate ligase [Bacillota bacterium]